MIQDIQPHVFNNSYDANKTPKEGSLIFSFRKRSVLVKEDHGFSFPRFEDLPKNKEYEFIYMGSLDETDCFLLKHHIYMKEYYSMSSKILSSEISPGRQYPT